MQPAEPVSRYVSDITYYSGFSITHTKERIIPDGGYDLIIDLTDLPKHVFDNEDYTLATPFRQGWVSGIRRSLITIEAGNNATMLVARFTPHGVLSFFKLPVHELTDRIVELECIFGNLFRSLRNHLLEVPSAAGRIAAFVEFLLQRVGEPEGPNQLIEYAIPRLQNGCSVNSLVKETGYSHKHFVNLFERHTGLTPKYYSRVFRFQRVLKFLETGKSFDWPAVAHRFGFYDQAHLINEFKTLAGHTPETYLLQKGPFLNFIPIFE